MPNPDRPGSRFEDLCALIRFLRSPAGCPWDRAQGRESLAPYLLEEAYEAVEAIHRGDELAIVEEVGDLLLHGAFQCILGEESGSFDASRALDGVMEKMRARHPDLFPGAGRGELVGRAARVSAGEQPAPGWEGRKALERSRGENASVVDHLPAVLPPLLRAYRLQERVAGVNFDWRTPEGAFAKVAEELEEVRAAVARGAVEETEREIGDLLFAVVNLARLLRMHPDTALRRAVEKFEGRFRRLEQRARQRGLVMGEASVEELDVLWEELKAEEREGEEGA